MNDLRAEKRADYYAACGQILGVTARRLGGPVRESTIDQWGDTLSLLATADDMSETDPVFMATATPATLLGILRLDPSHPGLLAAAGGLMAANEASNQATTLNDHFKGRAREAIATLNLLRQQSPAELRGSHHLWGELYKLAVAGIYLDSLLDAREDSLRLEQFSAGQLALSAGRRLVRVSATIEHPTWRSLGGTLHKFGAERLLAGKILRTLAF